MSCLFVTTTYLRTLWNFPRRWTRVLLSSLWKEFTWEYFNLSIELCKCANNFIKIFVRKTSNDENGTQQLLPLVCPPKCILGYSVQHLKLAITCYPVQQGATPLIVLLMQLDRSKLVSNIITDAITALQIQYST